MRHRALTKRVTNTPGEEFRFKSSRRFRCPHCNRTFERKVNVAVVDRDNINDLILTIETVREYLAAMAAALRFRNELEL